MSVATTSRLVLRHTRLFTRQSARRYASTTETASNAASKSKEVASNTTSKASQGLSRVTSSAGPAVNRVVQGVQTRIANIGGRAGRMVSFIESMIPPTIYYSKVGFEVAKLTFKGRNMSPPSAAAFQEYFSPLLHAIRNPTRLQHLITDSAHSAAGTASRVSPGEVLNMIRNMSSKDLVSTGVLAAEMLGFFTVGEMIGKFKVIGYRGGVHESEH